MWKNYFKISLRNILRNKFTSTINIGGLALGMTVSMLIGLWIYDELSFNQFHENYDQLAQVMKRQKVNGQISVQESLPYPLEKALRTDFGSDFESISFAYWEMDYSLNYKEQKISRIGNFAQQKFPEMISLNMIQGSREGLQNPKSILLSESTAQALFGEEEALDKIIKINNELNVKVRGIYEDLPKNSSFKNIHFIAPWKLFYQANLDWLKFASKQWGNNSFQIFVQVHGQKSVAEVSEKIQNIFKKYDEEAEEFQHEAVLQPMANWHLRSEFENGEVSGGRIEYLWFFGIIGAFVLFLACINFINLSTARSERRAKEVGLRKVIGSLRHELVGQFLIESFLTVLCAFVFALFLTEISLPFFNSIADKEMFIPWGEPFFWALIGLFIALTGLVAGSYPAFYLSSFQPVRVLKSSYRSGASSLFARKALVVLQFSVSVALIVGTLIVYQQIQYTKNRPSGYDQERLISMYTISPDFRGKRDIFESEFKKSGAVVSLGFSSSPLDANWSNNGGFEWEGKNPSLTTDFATNWVDHSFGETLGWEIISGRDFSPDFSTDSNAIILNESALDFMNIKDPIGMSIRYNDEEYRVIGLVKNLINRSPYERVKQSVYFLTKGEDRWMHLRLNPEIGVSASIKRVRAVMDKIVPAVPFEYKFADDNYAKKFENEERIGTLAAMFAILAILISCLGLFGLATFMAEKRAKEIGIRKVLGATIFSIWKLLSSDFTRLVLLSCLISIPFTYYLLDDWLANYTYRIRISVWVFVYASLGALLITLLTISYQAIKAALLNPVRVLKDE